MEESMYQRLLVAQKRLAEIDEELSNEDVMKDISHFRELSKERANIEPQVIAFEKYLNVDRQLADAKEMAKTFSPFPFSVTKAEKSAVGSYSTDSCEVG